MQFRIFLFTILGIIIGLGMMFAWSAYGYYQMIHADDPRTPEIFVIEGMAKIIRHDIAIELISGESYELYDEDRVETDSGSLAQILWPDHSVTRLGSDTRIKIHEMRAEVGYEKIEISFSLEKGKVWTHVVRSMIGDSYFETKLPKNGIVAGVRGSIYEINLENGYIHAVEHALSLKNTFKQKVLLMPGDLVDSENILVRLSRELIDRTWVDINTAADVLYKETRLREVSLKISEQSNTIVSIIDRWVRSLLGNMKGFEILTLQDILSQSGTISLASYSPEILTTYYQRIESIDARSDIDALRTAIIEASKTSEKGLEKLLDTMKRGAFWEMLDGKNILPSAQKLWENFAITPENIDTLLDTFEGQNLLDTLLSPSK